LSKNPQERKRFTHGGLDLAEESEQKPDEAGATRSQWTLREDILRVLGQSNPAGISLNSLEGKIEAWPPAHLRNAITNLEKGGLIRSKGGYLQLTENGEGQALSAAEKHAAIENYFRRNRPPEDARIAADILEHYISSDVGKKLSNLSSTVRKEIPLSETEPGQDHIVTDLNLDDSRLFERLVSMGIHPGGEIRILGRIRNGIVVGLREKKLALGVELVSGIKVLA